MYLKDFELECTKENDLLLDPMVGGGTTAIECKLLNRNLICGDINNEAIHLTKKLLNFNSQFNPQINVLKIDARNLSFIDNETIDFILTHPPYANIIKYSNGKIPEDLSNIKNLDEFCNEIEKIAKEFYRILKTGKYCAVLIGDTRKNKMYQPLAYMVMQSFLNNRFLLKEDIIKHQHNCKATGFWLKRSKEYNILLIMHEHIFIFQKQ